MNVGVGTIYKYKKIVLMLELSNNPEQCYGHNLTCIQHNMYTQHNLNISFFGSSFTKQKSLRQIGIVLCLSYIYIYIYIYLRLVIAICIIIALNWFFFILSSSSNYCIHIGQHTHLTLLFLFLHVFPLKAATIIHAQAYSQIYSNPFLPHWVLLTQ